MIAIDLSGKLALVTGATGDLGRVMVRTLGRAGADVVVHYHANRAKAESLVMEIEHLGRNALAVQADVTDEDSVTAMRKNVEAVLGAPDIVVANAVIQYDWKPVLEQRAEDYESQFRSCVLQNVLMSQAFVPGMIAKGWGRFIGINTECSMQCWEKQSAYVSGKRGMDGVLRVLAKEVGRTRHHGQPDCARLDHQREPAGIRRHPVVPGPGAAEPARHRPGDRQCRGVRGVGSGQLHHRRLHPRVRGKRDAGHIESTNREHTIYRRQPCAVRLARACKPGDSHRRPNARRTTSRGLPGETGRSTIRSKLRELLLRQMQAAGHGDARI